MRTWRERLWFLLFRGPNLALLSLFVSWPLHRFWYVMLPHLSPVLCFLFVTSILSSLQALDIISAMTQGGPVHSTTTPISKM